MLIFTLFFLLALIITLTNSYIIDKKITPTSLGEFLIILFVLLAVRFHDLNDFAIFYSVIVIFTFSNTIIRKKDIMSTNVVTTICMFTFVVIEIPIYIYQMLLSKNIIERVVERYVSTSLSVLLSMIIVLIVYRLTLKMIEYTDEFIYTRLTIYNFIVLFSIIAVNRFISRLNILNNFYFETILIMFISILIYIIFLYLSMHILQELNILLKSLSEENRKSQSEATNAFRKNHNTTNLLLTVNHLLKEQEYDKDRKSVV